MKSKKTFFKFVIPSVFSFVLSGIYAIVDGFFIGNSIGDAGLSAINIAYPVTALLQAVGTGIGMGGAVYYSIYKAENKKDMAKSFVSFSMWLLAFFSVLQTVLLLIFMEPILHFLGAEGNLLELCKEYTQIIIVGTVLQTVGTGIVPFIRNHGGPIYAMLSMILGFLTNIFLDYIFVWVLEYGLFGAGLATVIGQGVTLLSAILYLLKKKQFTLKVEFSKIVFVAKSIIKIGIAPFGLAMVPNISLIIINRFSMFYGGEKAIATYSCISYIVSVVYLIFQGVGDGSQPLFSKYYGEKNFRSLKSLKKVAYSFAIFLSLVSCLILYFARRDIGVLFGASNEVNLEIAKILPIFLISIPFVAINRVATSYFYATEKSLYSYILTFIEPILMLLLMLTLPQFYASQVMIWLSTVIARILSSAVALTLNISNNKKENLNLI